MSSYGEVALLATTLSQDGIPPSDAWVLAAEKVFPTQMSSRKKGCPKNAFLGLAETGCISGIPVGTYTRSTLNKAYAISALNILKAQTDGVMASAKDLWVEVMDGREKVHNSQMDVVLALWTNGKISS